MSDPPEPNPATPVSSTVTPSPPVEKKTGKKRKLRFDRRVQLIPVQSHSDYSASEKSASWYTGQECRSFKVQYFKESLESTTTGGRLDFQRAERIDAVRDLLLRAQDVQRKMKLGSGLGSSGEQGGDYSLWLADFYKHHSEACGVAALRRGIVNSRIANAKESTLSLNSLNKIHGSSSSQMESFSSMSSFGNTKFSSPTTSSSNSKQNQTWTNSEHKRFSASLSSMPSLLGTKQPSKTTLPPKPKNASPANAKWSNPVHPKTKKLPSFARRFTPSLSSMPSLDKLSSKMNRDKPPKGGAANQKWSVPPSPSSRMKKLPSFGRRKHASGLSPSLASMPKLDSPSSKSGKNGGGSNQKWSVLSPRAKRFSISPSSRIFQGVVSPSGSKKKAVYIPNNTDPANVGSKTHNLSSANPKREGSAVKLTKLNQKDLLCRWSAHGSPPESTVGRPTDANGAPEPKDLPPKPLRHITTPPLLCVPHAQ